ncbi:putative reverse transcriptase domain-containing protein [Tanacetum coccineum]
MIAWRGAAWISGDPEGDSEEEPDEDPEEEPEEAQEMDWEDEMNEPELIFPYEVVGSPYPPPPESSDSKLEMDIMGAGVVGVRPSEAIDVLAVHGESQPFKPQGPPDADRVAKAIAEYESNRANNLDNAEGSRPTNTGGVVAPDVHRCSYKTFLNCKPHTFNGTEGVVRLRHWPCPDWWNETVNTLGLANVNQTPWRNVKTMMTTEYCPVTDIQKIDQELWTLTVKGDDIEVYNNRFHELALICPDMVTHEKKKIDCYI